MKLLLKPQSSTFFPAFVLVLSFFFSWFLFSPQKMLTLFLLIICNLYFRWMPMVLERCYDNVVVMLVGTHSDFAHAPAFSFSDERNASVRSTRNREVTSLSVLLKDVDISLFAGFPKIILSTLSLSLSLVLSMLNLNLIHRYLSKKLNRFASKKMFSSWKYRPPKGRIYLLLSKFFAFELTISSRYLWGEIDCMVMNMYSCWSSLLFHPSSLPFFFLF